MASSSVILFKTGFSFISTQVTLGSDKSKAAGSVEVARIGPVPSLAVQCSVFMAPLQSSHLMILSNSSPLGGVRRKTVISY